MKHALRSAAIAATASILASANAHAGISVIRLYQDKEYTQGASGVHPVDSAVASLARFSTPGEFTAGTITRPDGTVLPLAQTSPVQFNGGHTAAFNSAAAQGTYTFTLSNPAAGTSDSASLTYSGIDAYPTVVPTIANYTALQHYDPRKAFNLDLASGFTLPAAASRTLTQVLLFSDHGLYDSIPTTDPSQTVFALPPDLAPLATKLTLEVLFYGFIDGPVAPDGASTGTIFRNVTITSFTSVPEPGAVALGLTGMGLLGIARLSRRSSIEVGRARGRIGGDPRTTR